MKLKEMPFTFKHSLDKLLFIYYNGCDSCQFQITVVLHNHHCHGYHASLCHWLKNEHILQ